MRLAVAVLALASVGFSLIGHEGSEGAVMLAKWAALTAPVVTMPLLGKVGGGLLCGEDSEEPPAPLLLQPPPPLPPPLHCCCRRCCRRCGCRCC